MKILLKAVMPKQESVEKSKANSNGSADTAKKARVNVLADLTNTQSILFKMVAVFLLLIVVPVAVIGYISTSTASSSLVSKTEDSIATSTMQVSSYFDLILDKAVDVSRLALSNSSVQYYGDSILANKLDPMEGMKALQNARDFISSLIPAKSSIADVTITFVDGNTIGNTGTSANNVSIQYDIKKLQDADWYKKVIEANGKPVWVSDHKQGFDTDNQKRYAVALSRTIKSQTSVKLIGVILVDLKYDAFSIPLSNIHLGKGDLSYIITDEGKVLSSKADSEDANITDRPFIKEVLKKSNSSNKGLFEIEDSGITYLVSYFKSESWGWTSLTVIPRSEVVGGAVAIRNRTILVGVLFAILSVLIGFVFSYKMSTDMKLIMETMGKAEKGNFTVMLKLKRKDEIGKLAYSFNSMLLQIKNLIQQSKEAAVNVGASSENMTSVTRESARVSSEIARTIEEVANGTTNQVCDIERSVESLSRLSEEMHSVVENTSTLRVASHEVIGFTSDGTVAVENLRKKAAETNEVTTSAVAEISQLNENIKSINKITNMLKNIADQTNLLSLNAAIEAARAGDAGKGFAVVADEVRKLAEQSNTFTKEIQSMVMKILKQTENSTNLVLKAEDTINEQTEMVGKTALVFSNINHSTVTLANSIEKITEMIVDMDGHKERVMAAMENISAASEQTAASTEEVAASTQQQLSSIEELDMTADKLNVLAKSLIASMERFTI